MWIDKVKKVLDTLSKKTVNIRKVDRSLINGIISYKNRLDSKINNSNNDNKAAGKPSKNYLDFDRSNNI